MNWEAGIRTPISRSRVCGPTVGRPPKENSAIVTEEREEAQDAISRCKLTAEMSFTPRAWSEQGNPGLARERSYNLRPTANGWL